MMKLKHVIRVVREATPQRNLIMTRPLSDVDAKTAYTICRAGIMNGGELTDDCVIKVTNIVTITHYIESDYPLDETAITDRMP